MVKLFYDLSALFNPVGERSEDTKKWYYDFRKSCKENRVCGSIIDLLRKLEKIEYYGYIDTICSKITKGR